jgi:anti-sigma B factor antagonist
MASTPFAIPTELMIDLRLCATGVSLTVRGEVDVHSAPVLRERLAEIVRQGEERVVVLLDGVTFMDSTGLGVLVGAHKAQRAGGGSLELVCTQPRLLRILRLTGLDRVLTVHDGSASTRES